MQEAFGDGIRKHAARQWPAAGDKSSLYKRWDTAHVIRQCGMCITAAASLMNCPITQAKADSLETEQASYQKALRSPGAQEAWLKSPCECGFSRGKILISNCSWPWKTVRKHESKTFNCLTEQGGQEVTWETIFKIIVWTIEPLTKLFEDLT